MGTRGAPTKFSEERAKAICDNLRIGCTRKASAGATGIDLHTLSRWIEKYAIFAADVTRAEDEAEKRFTGTLAQAAAPHDVVSVQRTVKTVFRTKKTKLKDGSVIEEPVALQEVAETTTTSREFDWRASESWLKRRRRAEWGDSIQQQHTGADGGPIDFRETLYSKLAGLAARIGATDIPGQSD